MAGKFIGIVYRVGETMSQDKTIESAGNAVSENLPNFEASETLAATMEGQHIPAEAPNEGAQQSLALNNVNDIEPADEKIKLAKKDDKDEEGRDKQEAEAVQIVSETVSEQHGAQAQNDSAYVEQDMEGYSFLEGVSGAESGYALGAAEASAAGAASSGGFSATVAGLSTVAKVGLATLGAAAAVAVADDDDDDDDNDSSSSDTPAGDDAPTGGTLLDFEGFTNNGDGTYALTNDDYPTYGTSMGRGVVDSSAEGVPYEADGTTSRTMLEVTKGEGTEWWSGLTLFNAFTGSDLIGDGTAPITMRVYAEQAGTLSLELESAGATAFKQVVSVNQGWNDVSMDVSTADASVNWTTFQMRPDADENVANQPAETKYWIDDVHFPLATIVTPSSGPQEAANLPTVGAGEFDVYVATNEDGSTDGGLIDDVNPSWGQSGSAEIEVHPQAGAVLKVNGMNYQGMTMTATDVSGKTSLHIDLWSATAGTVRLFLINTDGGEAGFNLDVTADTWNSFDIDLDAFGTVPDVAIHQLKFDNSEGSIGVGVTGLTDFYVDNLYFGDQAATVGTPPADPTTAAFLDGATTPTADENADGVVSIFSDQYTDVTTTNFMTQYSQGAGVSDLTINNGNNIKKYDANDWAIIETTVGQDGPHGYDVTATTQLNFSIYRSEATDLLVKVRDFGADGVYSAPADGAGMDTVDDSEAAFTLTADNFTADAWNEVSITRAELEAIGLTATPANVANIVLDAANTETFYIDDMYWVA